MAVSKKREDGYYNSLISQPLHYRITSPLHNSLSSSSVSSLAVRLSSLMLRCSSCVSVALKFWSHQGFRPYSEPLATMELRSLGWCVWATCVPLKRWAVYSSLTAGTAVVLYQTQRPASLCFPAAFLAFFRLRILACRERSYQCWLNISWKVLLNQIQFKYFALFRVASNCALGL